MTGDFRKYLFEHDHPRLAQVRELDPYAHGRASRERGSFTGGIIAGCYIWVLGVAGPRLAMLQMRRRLRAYSRKRDLRVIDARFETTRSD